MRNLYHKRPKFSRIEDNRNHDIYTKRAAIKVSPSVVSLLTYTGEEELNHGSGTIIDIDNSSNGIVLTSASLIRHPTKRRFAENILGHNLKIVVRLFDGRLCDGELCAHDFHYNIAAVRFTSDSPFSAAIVRYVEDCLDLNTSRSPRLKDKSSHIRRHSSSFTLAPGVAVIAVGRYFASPFDLMAAAGEYCLDRCEYDCRELVLTSCRTTECGDGGPLVNLSGEVIGITFYNSLMSPCMPMNVAHKWWEHYKKYRELRRPCLGMEVIGLHAVNLSTIEDIIQRFPSISKGVFVEKVTSGSSADSAGIRFNDVIIECGGKMVQSFWQFFEIIWDAVGLNVDVVVARVDKTTPLPLKLMVSETNLDEFNRWPDLK